MPRILISYRRQDSAAYAGRLADRLRDHFGRDQVFVDIDTINPGEDFVEAIDKSLSSCNVLLAVIGHNWLGASDAGGRRRLDKGDDFVRMEVAKALERHIRVVPVLVGDAAMPEAKDLPQDLVALTRRQALEISDTRFHQDVDRLIAALSDVPSAPAGGAVRKQTRSVDGKASGAIPWQWVAAAIVVLAAAAGLWRVGTGQRTSQPTEVASVTELTTSSGSDNGAGSSGPTVAVSALGNTLPPARSTAGIGSGASGIQFVWPGGDCWDILRGDQLVTYGCGTNTQTLQSGRYTLRGRHAPVFTPIDVDVKGGGLTQVKLGGLFEFTWPGGDCWDIMRGDDLVTYGCGTNSQALSAGQYTIKGRRAPVFLPFNIAIQVGQRSKATLGGVFVSSWSGRDCWDILRNGELVTYGCGAGKQALQGGKYTVKGRHAPVFTPFEIVVRDGAEFKWP